MTRQLLAAILLGVFGFSSPLRAEVTKYVRYQSAGKVSYGVLDGEVIRELSGDLFASPAPTGKVVKL